MTPQKLVPLVVLCGTIALTGWGAARLGVFGSSGMENGAIGHREATRGATPSSADAGGAVDAPLASAMSAVATAATSHLNLPEPTVAPAACPLVRQRRLIQIRPKPRGLFHRRDARPRSPFARFCPTPPPETRVQLVSLSMLKEVKEYPKPVVRPVETARRMPRG